MPRLNESVRPASDELPNSGKSLLTFGRAGFRMGNSRFTVRRGMGTLAALGFMSIAGMAGWFIGGHHEDMRQGHGAVRDIAARALGFPIAMVDVTGVKELSKDEILTASGMGPSGSLLFLNVAQVRTNVKALPLVSEATVRKLYPDRVNIHIVEREPYALWQQDGTVHVISVDGTIIDGLRDKRYLRLPHVVGANAHKYAKDYVALLEQVPEFRSEIRAGVLVSERRWNLKLNNGVEVKLPEKEPADALRQLIKLNKEARVLSKDIISIDLRVDGRAAFRLTEESAAARIEDFAKRLPKIRGRA
jgi:cell division protein FtsQ